MNADEKTAGSFEDTRINVKLKLAALWAAVMFLYVYGDIFSLFAPGKIQNLMDGKMGVGTTTPWKLLAAALLMTVPSVMVFFSLVLKPALNRWLNIIFGVIYSLIMAVIAALSLDPWWIFLVYLAIVEIAVTSLIVWYAWKWPKHQGQTF